MSEFHQGSLTGSNPITAECDPKRLSNASTYCKVNYMLEQLMSV